MKTDQIYYRDQTAFEFEATVLSCEPDGKQNRFSVELDKTLFYPGGGGQPADTGSLFLNEKPVNVTEMMKKNDSIRHITLQPIPEGTAVTGKIDYEHRKHYMQQHSGQHILSAVLFREMEINTSSIHLGQHETAIEIEREKPFSDEEVRIIEDKANRLIRSSAAFRDIRFDNGELSSVDLRRRLKTEKNVRVIEIAGYDAVGCGGIHCKDTGDVILIIFKGQEYIRGHLRTYWLIGDRAMEDINEKRIILNRLVEMFSAPQHRLLERIEGELEKKKGLEYELERQKVRTALRLKDEIQKNAVEAEGMTFYSAILDGIEMKGLRELCNALCARERTAAVLLSTENTGKGCWIAGCHENADFNFENKKRDLFDYIQGKGGGRKPQWQGGWNADIADSINLSGLINVIK